MATSKARLQLATQLRRLRKKYKLTQEQAAEKSGLDYRDYQRLESRKSLDSRLSTLEKIAKGFGIPLWKLLKF
jgi:transcriptional regulator with XRE-family HTH domain